MKFSIDKSILLSLVAIFILSLVPFFWFSNNQIINSGDLIYYLFDSHHLRDATSYWNSVRDVGKASVDILNISPYFLVSYLLKGIGFSLGLIEKIFFFSWIFFSGITMFYFVRGVFRTKSNIWPFSSAIFYMFNFYLLQYHWNSFNRFFFFYAFLPLIFYLFIKGLREKFIWRNVILFSLTTLLIHSTINITYFVILFVVLLSYFIFYFFTNSQKLEKIKFLAFSFLVVFLLNFVVLVPIINRYLNQSVFTYYLSDISFNRTELASSETSFLNILRLGGNWGFYLGSNGDFNFPYSNVYRSPFFIILSFLSIYLFTLAFILRKDKYFFNHKIFYYFSGVLLIGLFLVKGIHLPFSSVNIFLYEHVPGFGMFRNQFVKLGILVVFPTAVFFGFSILLIKDYIKNKKLGYLFCGIILVFYLVYNFPFFTGQIYPKDQNYSKDSRLEIPDYIYNSQEYINNKSIDQRSILAPFNFGEKSDLRSYDWGYNGSNVFFLNSAKPIFIGQDIFGESKSYAQKLFNIKSLNCNIFGLFNIGSLILESDRNEWQFKKDVKPISETFDEINKSGCFVEDRVIGKDFFYNLADKYFLPHFYQPNKIVILNESENVFDNLNDYQIGTAIFLNSPETNRLGDVDFNDQTSLEYKKINQTKYLIKIHQAFGELPIVFSEKFDYNWKVYPSVPSLINNDSKKLELNFISKNFQGTTQNDNLLNGHFYDTWFKEPIDNNVNHFIVNGYANGWLLDSNKICNQNISCHKNIDGSYDFEIIVEYQLQQFFYIGLFIFGLTLFSCLIYLSYDLIKKCKK